MNRVTGTISLAVNGNPLTLPADPSRRLSEVLRDVAGAKDVKVGCNAGDCGACTVLVDGDPVCACLMAAGQVQGRVVETQAGLVSDDELAQRLDVRVGDVAAVLAEGSSAPPPIEARRLSR